MSKIIYVWRDEKTHILLELASGIDDRQQAVAREVQRGVFGAMFRRYWGVGFEVIDGISLGALGHS